MRLEMRLAGLRSLQTATAVLRNRKVQDLPGHICQLRAPSPSFAKQSEHISDIHFCLQKFGVLKINLGFEDDNCDYLQQIIRNLHQQHGHGLPIDHSASRGWFWDIRPTQKSVEGSYKARSETANSFPWHTDCSYEAAPPRYFALQVLQPDRCNGGTLSILKMDRLVDLLSEQTRSILCRPEFRIDVPPEFMKRDREQHIVGSLLSRSSSREESFVNFEGRFREDIILPLTRDAKCAFEELKSVILGPEAAKHILDLAPDKLPRGSIILLDNRRWLHARNQVKDPKRHLRRVRWDACSFGPVGAFDDF
ncbi:hypothetical protein Egran_05462 [Elaphomyces granulatus]|uniref:TauD/TfdA-like domain-containing protein n=1 Tax=Elaphomyces granulatus TaxID=519963 RepID=A0A232LRH9_9EURO|nr:hypothetical protein Egran_05462 [Elaphomyces granulatus]